MTRAESSLQAARKNLELRREALEQKIADIAAEVKRIDTALAALEKKP